MFFYFDQVSFFFPLIPLFFDYSENIFILKHLDIFQRWRCIMWHDTTYRAGSRFAGQNDCYNCLLSVNMSTLSLDATMSRYISFHVEKSVIMLVLKSRKTPTCAVFISPLVSLIHRWNTSLTPITFYNTSLFIAWYHNIIKLCFLWYTL